MSNRGRCEVIRAFLKGRRRAAGNYTTDGEVLRLFGNEVARWAVGPLLDGDFMSDQVLIRDAGWRTVTTLGCLRDVLGVAGSDLRLVCKKGAWYIERSGDRNSAVEWTGSYCVDIYEREQGNLFGEPR